MISSKCWIKFFFQQGFPIENLQINSKVMVLCRIISTMRVSLSPCAYKQQIFDNNWRHIFHDFPHSFFASDVINISAILLFQKFLSNVFISVSSANTVTFSLLKGKSSTSPAVWVSASPSHTINWCLSWVRATDNSLIFCSLFLPLARSSSPVWWIDCFSVTQASAPEGYSAIRLTFSWSLVRI